MAVPVDHSGKKIGHFTVLRLYKKATHGTPRFWLCRCVCGKLHKVAGNNLLSGAVKSCGCKYPRTHGGSKTRTYRIWWGMVSRCKYKSLKAWKDYGGRGIRVCKRWAKFENFLADMGEVSNGMTLERKDNNKGYSPSNCRWATMRDQSRNKRNNRIVEYRGVRRCLGDWAVILGMKFGTLSNRLDRGWTVKRAIESSLVPKEKPMGKCNECSKLYKPMRKGLCNSCYLRKWRITHVATV